MVVVMHTLYSATAQFETNGFRFGFYFYFTGPCGRKDC